MKNTISIHIGDMFNKEHEFRKGNNPYFYVDAEKSKDNVYFELILVLICFLNNLDYDCNTIIKAISTYVDK